MYRVRGLLGSEAFLYAASFLVVAVILVLYFL